MMSLSEMQRQRDHEGNSSTVNALWEIAMLLREAADLRNRDVELQNRLRDEPGETFAVNPESSATDEPHGGRTKPRKR